MVRSYKKKTSRKASSPSKIRKGLNLIRKGYSVRTAARESGPHYSCLFRNFKATKDVEKAEDIPNSVLKISQKSRLIFTPEHEDTIAEYCLEMAAIGYGFNVTTVREIAFETALHNEIKVPHSWTAEKRARIDWFQGFMKRHPQLSIRTPEGCSQARASVFNKWNVETFYDKLEECLKRYPCFGDGSRVGNLDETANSTVQNTRKIVSPRGVKQVHKIETAERGVTVTTCCTVTANGTTVIPPVLIFPRMKFVNSMMFDAFPGSLGLANKSGYMTKEAFLLVMRHVIKHTCASKENPFLLLIDSFEAHLSLQALTLAKENGVILLTFAPHCTHKLPRG